MAQRPPFSPIPSNNELVTRRLAFVAMFVAKATRTTPRSSSLTAIYDEPDWDSKGQRVRQMHLNHALTPYIRYSPQYPLGFMTVNIQSLLFIDYPKPYGPNDWEENKPYLEDGNEFPRQCGTHILHNVWGRIRMLEIFLYPDTGVTHMEIFINLNAIYPSPRFNVSGPPERLNRHSLILGLCFSRPDRANPYFGERYYSRYNIPPDIESLWGVQEIHEQCLEEVNRIVIKRRTRMFAIYLCSGAKLVVLDSHQDNDEDHNRSLIQSGGVIVADGQIELCGPVDINVVIPWNLSDAVDKNFFLIDSPEKRQRIQGIRNPVIFLAPNESKFESIAWKLVSRQCTDPKAVKAWSLYAPEGGRIAAIEEWRDGMDEIMARHQYEQLHLATITCADPYIYLRYEFPNPNLHDRILGIGDYADRELIVSITDVYPNYKPEINLLVQYPKYVCDALVERQPFQAPLWPPVLYDVNDTTNHSLIPFSEKGSGCEMGEEYVWIPKNDWEYGYQLMADRVYQFNRYAIAGSDMSHELSNPEKNYMGLDGWMHWYAFDQQNQQKIKIGTYTTGAYVAVTKLHPESGNEEDLNPWG